jgi:hypothetical protein
MVSNEGGRDMKIRKRTLYIILIAPLAFFYFPLKAWIDNGFILFSLAMAYLLICSFLAGRFGK